MRSLLTLIILVFSFPIWANNLTIVLTSIPANTPSNDQIYISGSFNNWVVGSANSIMVLQSNGTRTITLTNVTGTIEFKFNRGNWDTPEGTASGGFRPNRTYNTTNGSTLNLTINGWEDLTGNNGSTANTNVFILSNNFNMPQLNRSRKIWMYLPNDYQTAINKRYPVIYVHDGQNIFDQATSFSGEWQVDETMSSLQNQGNYGAIVVAIDNGGSNRINEYSPWVNTQYGGGQGDEYMAFIVQTLKPYIDQNFRTLTTAPNTGLIGSSMGGLISLYGVAEYPQVFGKGGIFSPSIWFARTEVQNLINSKNFQNTPLRLYFVGGTNESSTLVSDMQNARSTFISKGVATNNTSLITHTDGAHAEWYWRREFGAAYQFLFPAPIQETSDIHSIEQIEFSVYPNPVKDQLYISSNFLGEIPFEIFTMDGKMALKDTLHNGQAQIDTATLPTGTYLLQLNYNSQIIRRTVQIH